MHLFFRYSYDIFEYGKRFFHWLSCIQYRLGLGSPILPYSYLPSMNTMFRLIRFNQYFCDYYKFFPLALAVVLNWLILFKSPFYSREYRGALAFYHVHYSTFHSSKTYSPDNQIRLRDTPYDSIRSVSALSSSNLSLSWSTLYDGWICPSRAS